MPRIVGRQQHRDNYIADNPEIYYRQAAHNQLLDHVLQEMNSRFGPLQNKFISVMNLVSDFLLYEW